MAHAKLELLKMLLDLGSVAFVTSLMIYFGYKLLSRFGVPFIASQRESARAMGEQAQSMASMTDAVKDFIGKDHNEHKEIILGLQIVGKELKTLVEEITRRDNNGHDRNKTQPGKKTDFRSIGSGAS